MDQALGNSGTENPTMNPILYLPLRDAIAFQTMVSSPATRETATGTFPLLKLPPELRTMIFEPLIQAGDLSILRVSKLINQEAVSLLKKVAILRMNLNTRDVYETTMTLTAKMTPYGDLTYTAPDYIQNLDICLNHVRWTGPQVITRLLEYFSGNQIARRSCKITMFFPYCGPLLKLPHKSAVYRVIAGLTGFRFLTLKLVYYINEPYETAVLRHKNALPTTDDPNRKYKFLSQSYKQVSNFLATSLGPAKLKDSLGEPYLSFEPRAFKPSLPHPSAP